MLLITSVIAAALTIIFVKLSFAVIGLRRKNQIGLGSGGIDDLERAIRAQGNFAEYVPFGIILIACLELSSNLHSAELSLKGLYHLDKVMRTDMQNESIVYKLGVSLGSKK
jgi:uncharacterized membrane protein YecN with MAPEG domain